MQSSLNNNNKKIYNETCKIRKIICNHFTETDIKSKIIKGKKKEN